MNEKEKFMLRAIALSERAVMENKGGPFGCVIVKDGVIIAEAGNRVTEENDPTAHAEVVCIRKACKHLQSFQLEGCELYTSCEPCPMCLGAIYWARPAAVYYANDRDDAARAGFDDSMIYTEINLLPQERKIPMHKMDVENAFSVFEKWQKLKGKKKY
jgi:tRNA(Arg) A34 adenosine deaminase TadA